MNKCFFIYFFICCQYCKGQNLVPNISFEDVNQSLDHCSPAGWFNVSRIHVGGYDHLQHIRAATGRHLLRIDIATSDSTRDYWETMLLCPLTIGASYKIAIKVSSEKLGPNLNDIGLYFPDKFIFLEADTLLQPQDYISFADAAITNLKNGWFMLEKQFVAKAGSRFVIIGNFSGSSNQDIFLRQKEKDGSAATLVDDLMIEPVNATMCDTQQAEAFLYSLTTRHVNGLASTFNGDAPAGTADSTPTVKDWQKPEALIVNDIEFEVNGYHFTDSTILDKFRNELNDTTIKKIKVFGFTDNSGSEKWNHALSLNRARETARLISQRYHIEMPLIEFSGKGVSNDYPDKKKNRRVEIYIYRR